MLGHTTRHHGEQRFCREVRAAFKVSEEATCDRQLRRGGGGETLLQNFLGISSDKSRDAIESMSADSSRLTEKH